MTAVLCRPVAAQAGTGAAKGGKVDNKFFDAFSRRLAAPVTSGVVPSRFPAAQSSPQRYCRPLSEAAMTMNEAEEAGPAEEPNFNRHQASFWGDAGGVAPYRARAVRKSETEDVFAGRDSAVRSPYESAKPRRSPGRSVRPVAAHDRVILR